MKAQDFRALVEQLGDLNQVQRDALVDALTAQGSDEEVGALIETRFAAAPRCGHCGEADFNRAYEAFAAATGITQMALVASAGERTIGCYHIQNVNAYQSRFKLWMVRFKGVASKYLPSYLGWRRMIERDGERFTPRHSLAAAMG